MSISAFCLLRFCISEFPPKAPVCGPRPTSAFDFRSESRSTSLFSSGMTTLALSELLGATVYDPSGALRTSARSDARSARGPLPHLLPHREDEIREPHSSLCGCLGDQRWHSTRHRRAADWLAANGTEGLFLLERDLLDQQVIDINGRKVVRVNDVDLQVDAPKRREPTRLILCCASIQWTWERAVRSAACCAVCAQGGASRTAGQDSAAQHSVEFHRRDRDRSGATGEAEDLARRSRQAASSRHRRHRRRSCARRAPGSLSDTRRGTCRRGPRRSRTQGSESDRRVARFRARCRHRRRDGSRCRRRPARRPDRRAHRTDPGPDGARKRSKMSSNCSSIEKKPPPAA